MTVSPSTLEHPLSLEMMRGRFLARVGALRPRLHRFCARMCDRRDWDALRRLIAVDARLEVVGASEGQLAGAPYFKNYAALPWDWRLSLERVDGVPCVARVTPGPIDTVSPRPSVASDPYNQR